MRRCSVAILDYGSGNLRSAQRALSRVGAQATVTADLGIAAQADGLVVPGVGAFAACMTQLTQRGADVIITECVAANRPVFGICVGMQVLCELGDEHGVVTPGLGLVRGEVRRLDALRLPHMGWNTVIAPASSALFAGINSDERFYFVHSYALKNTDGFVHRADGGELFVQPSQSITYAEHGEQFVAAVEHGPLVATQFHPEKSGDAGAQVLQNWLNLLT